MKNPKIKQKALEIALDYVIDLASVEIGGNPVSSIYDRVFKPAYQILKEINGGKFVSHGYGMEILDQIKILAQSIVHEKILESGKIAEKIKINKENFKRRALAMDEFSKVVASEFRQNYFSSKNP
jgi:hypothetical protein